ncbi:MAG: hypothetical protein KAJ95_08815, partial [Gammaproteobacteria bacterium]|nr:hypothetical protein [Gammaproteobacteria bacterium]
LPVENGCKSGQLTVLLIHDSFGSYLRPYFNERFNRVIYSREYGFHKLKDLIVSLKPDVVIEEIVTRDIYKTLTKDIELEEVVVEYQMSKIELKTVLDITLDKKGDSIQSEYNAEIRKDEKGYLINATTADPQLFFQFKLRSKNKRYNAMVELTVPGDTQLQLFYMPEKGSNFTSRFSVRRTLKKGYNKVFFHIPGPVIKGEMRLDPGGLTGSYILHALVIKEG